MSKGILILDAHRSASDIMATAVWLRRKYIDVKIVMPIAGYVQYIPILSNIIRFNSSKLNIKLWPVFRKEEVHPINLLMRVLCMFYPSRMNEAERRAGNDRYLAAAKETLINNGVVLVAPYGSPVLFGGKIKYGVRKLIETKPRIIATQSTWNWEKLRYMTKAAELKDGEIAQQLEKLYRDMEQNGI